MSDEKTVRASLDAEALDQLRDMTGNDPEFLAEMIDTFRDEGPRLVSDMQLAARNNQPDELRRAAHSLKSNCRTFGAKTMADLCEVIERRAAVSSEDGVVSLVTEVASTWPGVDAALRDKRPSP